MKIIVSEGSGKQKKIVLPTGMFLNRLIASMMPDLLEKKGIAVTRAQVIRLAQTIRSFRRHHPDWKTVEIDCSDGDHIEISL